MADTKSGTRGAAARGGPPSREVAKVHPAVDEAGGLVRFVQQYAGSFGRVVPSHVDPDAFITLAVAYVNRDDNLRQAATANPQALVLALRECAVLGHLPMPKVFALVPFRDNSRQSVNGWAIAGIETVHGVVDRMYRAGGVQSIRYMVVRRNDVFRYDFKTQTVVAHDLDPMATMEQRGPMVGVYAYAVMMAGGLSRAVWMNAEEVLKHKAMAKTDKFWEAWPEAMWEKTALHALEKAVPTSAEYRTSIAKAEAAAARELPTEAPPTVPATPARVDNGEPAWEATVVDDHPAGQDGRHEPAEGGPGAEAGQDGPGPQGGAEGGGGWDDVEVAQPGSGPRG